MRLLLRVRRGQDRRGDDQAAVHERGDGKQSVDFMFTEVGRFADGEPDVLRRRDADELQDAASRRSPTRASAPRRSARKSTRASRRTRRCCAKRSSTGSSRTTSASRCRSTARASSRTSSASSRTAWAATTSSCRNIKQLLAPAPAAAGRRARHAHRAEPRRRRRSTSICSRRSASGRSASRR